MEHERRILGSQFTLRSTAGVPTLVGHAAVFNRDSELIAGSFIERIAPGAFRESIAQGDDVRALINHDPSLILARTTSRTLLLREDQHGLYVEIQIPRTTYAQDLLESTKRGDISQMSFGFTVSSGGERWERGQNGAPDIRTLLSVRLFDVSPVTYPAYPDTDVAVRSHSQFVGYSSPTASASYEVQLRRRRLRLEMVAGDISDPSQELLLRRRRAMNESSQYHSTDTQMEKYLSDRLRHDERALDAEWGRR